MVGKKKVICTAVWRIIAFIGSMAAPAVSATAQTPSLSLSGGLGTSGATVILGISLNAGGGTPPASVQWDLTYSTSDLSFVAYAIGAAGSAAGKLISCNSISAGDVRCIVVGMNTAALGNGVLATLTFGITAGTTDTSTLVSLLSPVASEGNANPLNITASGATNSIKQPVGSGGLSNLSCSPASVTPPTSSICTVTLTSAASNITTINLSSDVSAAIVPASVDIGAGSSSATFTVIASVVNTNMTAEITAILGGSSEGFALSLIPASTCAYSLSTNTSTFSSGAGSGTFNVVTSAGCSWSVTNNSTFITVTAGTSGVGNGTVSYSVAANSGASRVGTLTIATQAFTVTQSGQTATAGLAFYPLTPCRIADTRVGSGFGGAFGPPSLPAGASRNFPIPASGCNVPADAQAYSLNITVVPPGPLGYLTAWPTGSAAPLVATLNSLNGSIVGNAAIVSAGTNGSISLFASNATDVVIDINGYFAPPTSLQALAFYPVIPCRIADTRSGSAGSGKSGAFGPPSLSSGAIRNFPIPLSSCGIPSSASAYSVRMTVVALVPLGFLTTWPAGQPLPLAATLNALSGGVVGNEAIVPAGTNGAISVFASDNTDLVIDINGYFAPPSHPGALYFYSLAPCRVADTRSGSTGSGLSGAFGPPSLVGGASRDFPMLSSSCGILPTAQAYSLNMTVVPPGPMGFLTAWPAGQPLPLAATVNALTGGVVGSAAIVPGGTYGDINVFASNPTDLVIDINGYFAP